jgi:toxin CcdB
LVRTADQRDIAPRLNPVFEIDGVAFTLATQLATAVHRNELGGTIASLDARGQEIVSAIDMLVTGV